MDWLRGTVPDISVYIPAYNVANFLPRSIESVLAQTIAPVEILVIDDGSRDDSAAIAGRYPGVTVIRHERNSGLAAARNTAFRVARTEFVASLDADCVAEKTWLEALVPHLGDPEVAGAGGYLVEGVQDSLADRWRRTHMPQEWGTTLLQNPKFLFGCNNIFRRAAVLDAGGYDESMRTNGEDCDLSRRLLAKKWKLIYDPTAQATHLRHDTVKSILDTYWRWWKFGVNAYASRISLRSVLGHAVFVHFRYTFLELFSRDWRARRFELLPLDTLLLAYLPYRDFRLWLASNGLP
jgi:cellulose synthase/poly-beta-1,6-N-acetylglucosamine synthase-like glycosyltransferase